jgi:hypothetical protein
MTGHNHSTYGARAISPPSSCFQHTLEFLMLDVLYLVGATFFFVISVIYTTACDHL